MGGNRAQKANDRQRGRLRLERRRGGLKLSFERLVGLEYLYGIVPCELKKPHSIPMDAMITAQGIGTRRIRGKMVESKSCTERERY